MGERLHELSLEQIVALELLQDWQEVEKLLSSLDEPLDVHDCHGDFGVDDFLVAAESEEFFRTHALIGSHLNLHLIQKC